MSLSSSMKSSTTSSSRVSSSLSSSTESSRSSPLRGLSRSSALQTQTSMNQSTRNSTMCQRVCQGKNFENCDYCVSPSPKNWVFGFSDLVRTLGSGLGDYRDWGLGLGLGLDNSKPLCSFNNALTILPPSSFIVKPKSKSPIPCPNRPQILTPKFRPSQKKPKTQFFVLGLTQ